MLFFVYLVCISKWSATQIYGRRSGRGKACAENELIDYKPSYDSPGSGEWLAHAHKDLVHRYHALFFCPTNFNIKIGPGDEANADLHLSIIIAFLTRGLRHTCGKILGNI